jgi:hypothetical protein
MADDPSAPAPDPAGEPPSPPSAPSSKAAAPPSAGADITATPASEAQEVDRLLKAGHNAPSLVALLTGLGVGLLLLLGLYYGRYDVYPLENRTVAFPAYLDTLVENQVVKDRVTYGARRPSDFPVWPEVLYGKLRMDIYLVAGGAFLLAFLFVQIALARARRNDLLVYRALGREVEKLRRRVAELEGRRPRRASREPSAAAKAEGEAPRG